ncbi:MAG TPA: MaoC/PaaZ C-terminal domain-containing protein [Deltaproteobacteria bacterium]|nr:MaoC/PaaZ C-terminal domain-containing protein [Deltaproteobacteria bacterium]HQI00480.1 MaoC/PaaZ C-terminal domain-containing protein [Deltaproteobacteria bacterium]HQJ07829.1 MaoC/PaaZ C-terminal domain-containing protein [Deltaproteobacteria bacterium]
MADVKIEKGTTFSSQETVDRYRAIYYAGASGDFNPIHIDPEFGKMVGLGGVILHGLCTVGFVVKTITDWQGDPGKLKKFKCRFASPVHLEDVITTSAEVVDVKDGRASIALKVTNQNGVEVETNVSAEVEI